MRAEDNGGHFEAVVSGYLVASQLKFIPQYWTSCFDQFGSEVRVDYYITQSKSFPDGWYCQCRYQSSEGSADKKIAFDWECAQLKLDKPCIFVFEGVATPKQIAYCRERITGNAIAAMNLSEFFEFTKQERNGLGRKFIVEAFDPEQQVMFGGVS